MKHIIRLQTYLLISCITFLLFACAYNSKYKKPDVPVSQEWSVSNQNISNVNESNLPYIKWWTGFNDPTLNRIIESGLVNNNSINMSRGHIEAAEGELKKIQLGWIPDLNLLLGYSNNPATGFPGILALIVPSYTINVFSQIKQQKQAKYQLAQEKAQDDAVKLTIISQITASYFTYMAEVEHKQLLQNLANDLSRLADIANKVYNGGLSSNINVEELRSQVNLIHGEQHIVEQNIIVSRNAIHYLLNQNPGNITSTNKFSQLNNKNLIPASLPITVLSNRPDMQVAENRLRASNEGIGIAASQLLPSIQLDYIGGPIGGNNNAYFPNPILQNSVNFNDELLRVPAFKASAFGDIAKARGLDRVSYYNYIDVLQKAMHDTTNALSANDLLTKKLDQTESASTHLARAYDLNKRLYERGIQSYMDTLNSKIAWDRSQINVNQAKLQQMITLVNLYQEFAGGYKSGESTTAVITPEAANL